MKELLKGLAGLDRIRGWQLSALHAGIRRHGWTEDTLGMNDEQAAVHFANGADVDEFSRLAIRFFHKFKLEFLFRTLGREYIESHTFFEIGDSDGLVLKALGKSGFSVNNDPRCIALIRQNGVEAILGVGESLSTADKSFDVAMAFETLEHSLNPVAFLQEMVRIAREKVVLSIPGVARTLVHPRVRGARVGEEHVFELCSRDLLRLATHLSLRPRGHVKFPVFAPPSSPIAWAHYYAARTPHLFGGCFRWFDFYVFDVVDEDHGVAREKSAAVYAEQPWLSEGA